MCMCAAILLLHLSQKLTSSICRPLRAPIKQYSMDQTPALALANTCFSCSYTHLLSRPVVISKNTPWVSRQMEPEWLSLVVCSSECPSPAAPRARRRPRLQTCTLSA